MVIEASRRVASVSHQCCNDSNLRRATCTFIIVAQSIHETQSYSLVSLHHHRLSDLCDHLDFWHFRVFKKIQESLQVPT